MNTYEMGKYFVKDRGLKNHYAETVDKMICIEAQDAINDGFYKGQRNQWAKATQDAFERIEKWWKDASEYRIKSLSDFVASHRRACVWTVLFARENLAKAIMDDTKQGHYICQNCEAIYFGEDQLINPIPDLEMRVAPGEIMPAGECPKCGAVVHLDKLTPVI